MYLALEDRAPKNVWPRAPHSLNPALVTHYARATQSVARGPHVALNASNYGPQYSPIFS